jgi:hypothetical protein
MLNLPRGGVFIRAQQLVAEEQTVMAGLNGEHPTNAYPFDYSRAYSFGYSRAYSLAQSTG